MGLGNLTDIAVSNHLLNLLKEQRRTNALLEQLVELQMHTHRMLAWQLENKK